jgi:hypothetical protein
LCDILDCEPGDLIELTRETAPPKIKATGANSALATLRPRRAEVTVNKRG